MLGPFGIFFVVFLAVILALGLLGLWIRKREAKKDPAAKADDAFFSEEEVGNVLNLNDRFNRARYMEEDGK